jgi:hypothetical protein
VKRNSVWDERWARATGDDAAQARIVQEVARDNYEVWLYFNGRSFDVRVITGDYEPVRKDSLRRLILSETTDPSEVYSPEDADEALSKDALRFANLRKEIDACERGYTRKMAARKRVLESEAEDKKRRETLTLGAAKRARAAVRSRAQVVDNFFSRINHHWNDLVQKCAMHGSAYDEARHLGFVGPDGIAVQFAASQVEKQSG